MAYFAQLDDDGLVTQVISISNDSLMEPAIGFPETEIAGQVFIREVLQLDGVWRQTSYNATFRGRYAGVGFRYDEATDEFVPPGWQLVDGEWTAPPEPETV